MGTVSQEISQNRTVQRQLNSEGQNISLTALSYRIDETEKFTD